MERRWVVTSCFALDQSLVQYISLPADAVRPDSRLYRQVYDGTDFPELKMCGYNGKKWLLRQWFWLFYNSF